MAFESKKDKMGKALKESLADHPVSQGKRRKVGRPAGKTKFPYQFTLKPQNREKLDKIAEEAGYSGVSTFLDEWIEKY